MELMEASLDKLYKKVYERADRRVPEEVLRQIAYTVSINNHAWSMLSSKMRM